MSLEETIDACVRRAISETLGRAQSGPPRLALCVAEAAEQLGGVNPATVRKWIKSGLLPASKAGGEWLIKVADLDPFLARTRVVANSRPVADNDARVARFVAAGKR